MSEPVYMHYTPEPLVFDPTKVYEQNKPHGHGKPVGFWISVLGEDDWPTWCTENEWGESHLAVPQRVTLAAEANVLHITTVAALEEFYFQFAVETEWERRHSDLWQLEKGNWPIDWATVTQKYDGIVIAPYQWSRRLGLDWYYCWDCASGCIWTLDAIESVAAVEAVR